MRFHFDFGNYFKMLRLAWGEPSARARRRYLVVLLLAVPAVSLFHALCFALDPILFPSLRRVEMRAPVFVVGHARSGTTLVHRLLGQDEGRFSSFRLYELYFPSLLQKRLIRWGAGFDERRLGGWLHRRVAAWEERRYGAFRDKHAMGLGMPEEDDIIYYWSMASGFWITKMPWMGELDFYSVNDWPERKRRRLHAFYRACVERQLALNGPEKTHLSKNPIFSGRVESLIESFPDARIVVAVRDPRETIPSLLKLVRSGWKALGWSDERQRACLRILAEQSFHTYQHPLEALAAHPGTPASVVDYRELLRDPARAVEGIYRDLGLEVSPEYREKLGKLAGRAREEHRTTHRYSLEEFGLEADAIRARLADLFERFDWDGPDERGPDAAARPDQGSGTGEQTA